MTPFETARDIYSDRSRFFSDLMAFTIFGYVLTEPNRWICLAQLVNTEQPDLEMDNPPEETDAWYIHLFAGKDMDACYEKLLDIADKPKIVFSRMQDDLSRIKVYDRDKFKEKLKWVKTHQR